MSGNELSNQQQRCLDGLLDVIIPPGEDGRLPGAGELGLARLLAPLADAVVQAGLAALDDAARSAGAQDFASLPLVDRRRLVDEVSVEHPRLVPPLIHPTYMRYYREGRVLEGLGLGAHPPHPEGYELEVGDLGLLDSVRSREPMYRS